MMTGAILDNLDAIRRSNGSEMASLIAAMPEQLTKAPAIFKAVQWPEWTAGEIDHIVVLGMGGSAIGGDLVRVHLADDLAVPTVVVRDYRIPRFVSARTLVFASSYSGNTEETLSAVGEAHSRGSRIVAVSSGGEVGRLATANGWPWMKFPGGLPPRAALGYSFSALLLALAGIFRLPSQEGQLRELAAFLTRRTVALSPDIPTKQNRAKQLAVNMHGRIPATYGAAGPMAIAALRWKGQICENAENLAMSGEAPEFNHNEIVGWGLPEGSENTLIAILIQSPDDHPRTTLRLQIVQSLLEQKGIPVETVLAEGENRLQRLFSVIQLADWASFYLAVLNDRNPMEVESIDFLKQELGRRD